MNAKADKIFISTSIFDSVSNEPFDGYVAIKDNKILRVGKEEVSEELIDTNTQIIDCGSNTICSGFADTHTFFSGYIIDNFGINLSKVDEIEKLEEVLLRYLKENQNRETIFGNHLDMNFVNNDAVDEMLESLCREKPIVLFVAGHGTCAMNKKAIELFGFSPNRCYSEAIYKIMRIYLNDRSFVDEQLVEYMKMLNSRGITAVKEMGYDDFYGFTDVLKEFDDNKQLTLRISFMSQPVGSKTNIEYGKRMQELFKSEYVRFSGYNQMTDGLILSKQGHLMEPYENSDTICEKKIDYEQIENEVLTADENGFRFTLHSEGDGAFHAILNIYEKCKKKDGKVINRHGITDLELTHPEDEKRMADLGVFGEIYAQIYMWDTYDNYVNDYEKVIGHGRRCRYLNYKSLTTQGVRLCGATDLPLLIPSIPEAIYFGCANYCKDRNKQINPNNGLSIPEMLKAWTINSQYAMEREDVLGTLEEGKIADIVIFDNNIFSTPMQDMLKVQVQKTLIGGKEVYSKN